MHAMIAKPMKNIYYTAIIIFSGILFNACHGQLQFIEMAGLVDLKNGVGVRQPSNEFNGPIVYTLIKTDLQSQIAFIRIEDKSKERADEGWVKVSEYATFSSLIGPHALKLLDIGTESATVRLYSAAMKGTN
jgi:hypothetical protein